jgi:hypothetical protein
MTGEKDMRVRYGINFKRIGITAAMIAVTCGAAFAASVAATADHTAVDTGPMAERVFEADNQGMPSGVAARFERVRAQLSAGSPDRWAAEYHEGDGLGENVTLAVAPGAGVATSWFGCMGLYGANEGDVEADDNKGSLTFRFVRPNEPGKFGMFPATLQKVAWGTRRYLIDPRRYADFVNAINVGLEPNSFVPGRLFLLASGDEAKPAPGLPDLPEEWLAQIREKPLLVTVSSVEQPAARGNAETPSCRYRFRFQVPAGETLPVGIDLFQPDDRLRETATIVAVDGREATATIEFYEPCSSVRSPPSPGRVFSTGAYTPLRDVASR